MLSRRELLQVASLAAAAPQALQALQAGDSLSARLQRRYVDCRYGLLHVTSTPPGTGALPSKPPLFCLPMSPRSGRDFDEIAALLARDRWVHAPDLPGYGGSDAPPAPPTLEEYAAALIDGIKLFDPQRRNAQIDILGQHTGAALGIEIARQAPRLVRRMVFIGVPMFAPEEIATLRERLAKPRPYFEDPEFVGKAWQRELNTLAGGLSKERMLLRFAEIMRAGMNSWWSFNAVFNYPLRERIIDVKAPMHAIVLNELLAPNSRAAMKLARRGSVTEMPDLPGAALDFAAPRLAEAALAFLDSSR